MVKNVVCFSCSWNASQGRSKFIPFLRNFKAFLHTYAGMIPPSMHARELNHFLTGEAEEVAGGLIARCCREGRDFPEYAELVSALRQQYQVGGQEAKAFLARSRPTQATSNASGRN